MTDAVAAPRPRHPWTLRRRLVLGILALLAAASVIIGAVSVLAVRGFLLDRLDEQLESALDRTQLAIDGRTGDAPVPSSPGATLRFGVQGPGTVSGVVVAGSARAGVVTEGGDIRILTDARTEALLDIPATGEAVTIDLGGGLGAYRAAGERVADDVMVVTALPLADVQATVGRLLAVVIVVALAALGAAAVAGRSIVVLALRPLDRVAATASAVAEMPLAYGDADIADRVASTDADPSTEVGRVGAAFNRMLDHITAALAARRASELRVRRFVADASHELRTPLASIRGYAELTRRAGHDLPPDVVHSMGRVETEAVRMTSLVEDLLLLARLDEGRDLERGEVDLSSLLIDAVSDANAAGPEHEWALELPAPVVTVRGDDARLRQVFGNLLANARTHTPPGTSVEVRLELDVADAVVSVSDDGPGIPSALLPRLFERFARGDSSRSRAAGSTGLGLAIVHAVIEGHGGTVSVESAPGRTTFTVRMPGATA